MPSCLRQYLVARVSNPVWAACRFFIFVSNYTKMDDEELFLIGVCCLILSFWAQYCQPRHRYVRAVEYKAFLFNLDGWPEEKQRRMMRYVHAKLCVASANKLDLRCLRLGRC